MSKMDDSEGILNEDGVVLFPWNEEGVSDALNFAPSGSNTVATSNLTASGKQSELCGLVASSSSAYGKKLPRRIRRIRNIAPEGSTFLKESNEKARLQLPDERYDHRPVDDNQRVYKNGDFELAGVGLGSCKVYRRLFAPKCDTCKGSSRDPESCAMGIGEAEVDTDICCMRHIADLPGLFSKTEIKQSHSTFTNGLLKSRGKVFKIVTVGCSEVKIGSSEISRSAIIKKSANNEVATAVVRDNGPPSVRPPRRRPQASPLWDPANYHPILPTIVNLLHAAEFAEIIQVLDAMQDQLCGNNRPWYEFVTGLSHFKLGKYTEAIERLNKSAEAYSSKHREGQGSVSLSNTYIGDSEFSCQHYLQAVTHYKKATQLYSARNVATLFRMVPPSCSAVHAKCGAALRHAHKMMDAVQEYKLAIAEADKQISLNKDDKKAMKDKLSASTSLGNLYQTLGENTSALIHYENSVKLSEQLLDYISLGWAHGNMGNAYLGLFQKDKALHHLQKSLELTVEHEPTPQAIGRTYNNLGTAYQSLGELGRAQEHYDLALSQAIYGDDIPGQARVYGNIGNVLMLRKKYADATPHYGEVLKLSKDRTTLSTAHHNRGCAYYEWAEMKMDDLASISSPITTAYYLHGPDFPNPSASTRPRTVIPDIADYYRHGSEDLKEVVKYHEESLENIKGSSKGLSLSISLFESNSRTFHRLQDCLVNLGEYTQALLVAEQSRARTLGELMLKRKGWSLPRQLHSPFPFDQIVAAISTKSNPVLYMSFTGARLLGWVFIPTEEGVKMNMFEVPMKDDQFDGKSFDYHLRYTLTDVLVERSFEMYRGVSDYDEEASKPVQVLYNLVAKPLIEILGKHTSVADVSKIVVVSDSYTALLPYSCLFHPVEGFLGDRISFQLMPSLLTMGVMDQLPNANVVRLPADAQGMCIAGNPTIPQFLYEKEVWNLGKLPHATREAEWVSHILKTTPILEEQATKTAVLMRIMSAKVIHLATHGSATKGFLAFGAMVSTGPDKLVDSKSVLLYPEDVEELNINPALVVLSSCDSGRGTVKADGIQGMARAFILAGAQAVLTTLWRVPDESAAVFMQFFYQYMVDGKESTLALRKAILSIRCFSKYSQYIHWSGYQLTGRDVHFESSTPSSTHQLQQSLGPSTVFPRLLAVRSLESALVNNPCYPTDVQILQGCSGVKPSEVVIDFIHSSHQYFKGGIFWINCKSKEFIAASIHYIEKTIGSDLEHLSVAENRPVLFVLDHLTSLPASQPLRQLMKHRHTHFVVLYKHYRAPDKLIRAIDHELLRGSKIHEIEPLTMIHSTQRTVYTLQEEFDLAPKTADQHILENLAEFTSGSPVLVDITSQILLTYLTDNQSQLDSTHAALKKFAGSISLNETRERRGPETLCFRTRDVSQHMKGSVPSVSTLIPEQRDEWDTKCRYDSWDSICELMNSCQLGLEEELLLNCLSLFGANPVPKTFITSLSSFICKTSGKPHLASSLLKKLRKMKFVQRYPLPVVMYSAGRASRQLGLELLYVPQYIANFLWKAMEGADKVFALATNYLCLSTNLPSCPEAIRFLMGLTVILIDAFELNSDLMSDQQFKQCYEKVYKHYIVLQQALQSV